MGVLQMTVIHKSARRRYITERSVEIIAEHRVTCIDGVVRLYPGRCFKGVSLSRQPSPTSTLTYVVYGSKWFMRDAVSPELVYNILRYRRLYYTNINSGVFCLHWRR